MPAGWQDDAHRSAAGGAGKKVPAFDQPALRVLRFDPPAALPDAPASY